MTVDLPAPPVPLDLDIRDCPWMPLEVARLCDSDLMDQDPAVVVAAIRSWCKAWHQVPAGSLPDDDRALARLLAPHDGVKGWQRLRAAGALRGWIKCAGGRLYHPVVCAKATEALASVLASERRRGYDRDRKKRERVGVEPDVHTDVQQDVRTDTYRKSQSNPPPTLHDITLPESGTSSPSSVVSPREPEYTATDGDGAKTDDQEMKPEKPLSRRAQSMDIIALRLAVKSGNLHSILTVFRVDNPSDPGWARDTDGLQIGEIIAILAWKKGIAATQAIRMPSGFRHAFEEWRSLKIETRRHLTVVRLSELGIEHGIRLPVGEA